MRSEGPVHSSKSTKGYPIRVSSRLPSVGSLVHQVQRWFVSRASLERQVKTLSEENTQLREKIKGLQKAKTVAEQRVEELRKERDGLKQKVAEQKKTVAATQKLMDEVHEKISDLREENERLRLNRRR